MEKSEKIKRIRPMGERERQADRQTETDKHRQTDIDTQAEADRQRERDQLRVKFCEMRKKSSFVFHQRIFIHNRWILRGESFFFLKL